MDKTLKKSDISKRILETRKQTEELKAQLQNLIDSGINSSLEYKNKSHSHLDKENIKESENKVQIIKSYDTKHSQHVTKPSSSRINLPERLIVKPENEETNCKKARHYDVNKTREYIKKQREKRLEQHKLQNEEKKKAELQKQKLQELHKKSLELVTKNVQAKRERSKSRERIDFVRPIKEIPRSRSTPQEKLLTQKPDRRGKSVERAKKISVENLEQQNPNLLYPPLPNYISQSQEKKIRTSKKSSPSSYNKIVIISGNSTDRNSESPESDHKNEGKPLKPKNLFQTPKTSNTLHPPPKDFELYAQMQINKLSKDDGRINAENQNSSNDFHKTTIVNGNSTPRKTKSSKLDTHITHKHEVKPKTITESHSSKCLLENESNNNFTSVNNILDYKKIRNKNSSNVILQSDKTNLPVKKSNNLTEIAIGTDSLEKFTKETQTNDEPKLEFPSWLQENKLQSNPFNFINTVKRKLQYAINSPTTYVDVGVQSSLAQENSKPDSQPIKSKEVLKSLQQSPKSSKKSDLKSFISHKCLNLDQKTIDNIELIPKNFNMRHLTSSKNEDSESDSDTSKNIPEISSESGTSLKKNAQSVKQNGTIGLDVERISSLKLRSHNIDKSTHTIHSGEVRTETPQPISTKLSDKKSPHKLNSDNPSNTRTVSKIRENDQYTSDFQASTQSESIHSSVTQTKTSKNVDYQNLIDPHIVLYSERHSNNIPKDSEKHSSNTTTNIKTHNSDEEKFVSSMTITVRNNSSGKNISHNSIQNMDSKDISASRKTKSSDRSIETETQKSRNKSEESQKSNSITSDNSSAKSDKFKSLYSDFHPSATVSEMLSKSDSNLQYINTRRGSEVSSENSKFTNILPLKEPTLSLVIANEKNKDNKIDKHKSRQSKLLKKISLKSDTNNYTDQTNTNEIHLKFEAEIHLLNDFNESLRQFSEVEKAFNSLKSKNDINGAANKIVHNQDTQTSLVTKSSTSNKVTENSNSDGKSELSSINFSRGFLIDPDSISLNVDTTVSKLDDTNNAEDFLNFQINNDLSNFENLQSNNFAGMTLRMFEQLIKDEDVRLENLKTILKIREQALLDRTKGELAWLEIQRKHLRETGKLHEASLIKKKQRGILVNHQKERHEMQRLKQMQKAASIERKIILKEQRNLIKHQLSTDKMLSKIKVNTPRERRLSGPLKVIQSHTESIRSETSFSRRSSSEKEKETYSVMSHTQSIVSMVSEVSGEEAIQSDRAPRAESTDLAIKLPNEACGVPISQMKRTLLIREAALQKRRKAALELLQWHRKLLEEEKRITELESTASTIISQIPNNAPPDITEKYQFKGKQLNQLWFNLTGCKQKKFSENKVYPMSQIALERFCKSAREYSTKTKVPKRISDSEISDYSVGRTDDSINENIPEHKVTHSASVRTESGLSQRNANDYTSDFEIESLQDIVNVEDMDVVDKSINQLIDNFSKIQEDISSLSIKQSLKSDADLEVDESIRSEKTDSEVEISVIETAKTSKENYEDIDNSSNDKGKNGRPDRTLELNSSAEVHSIVEENSLNIEGKNNLNTSKEILEELSYLESQVDEAVSIERKSTLEDVEIVNKAKDNLNKTEEILLKLSKSEDNRSIISSEDNLHLLVSETKISTDKISAAESEGILLNLQPLDDTISKDVLSAPVISKQDTEQLLIGKSLSENLISEELEITENKDEEKVLLSLEKNDLSSVISEKPIQSEVSKDVKVSGLTNESNDNESLLHAAETHPNSEIISAKLTLTEESVKVSEGVKDATEEIRQTSDKIFKNLVVTEVSESKEDANKTSIVDENFLHSEETSAEVVEELPYGHENITKEKPHSVEISEIFESCKETEVEEGLSTDENTEKNSYMKPLRENVMGMKDKSSQSFEIGADSEDNEMQEKVMEESSIEEVESIIESSKKEVEETIRSKPSESTITQKTSLEKSFTVPNESQTVESEKIKDVSQRTISDTVPSTVEETDKSQTSSFAENITALLSKEDINSFEEKELDSLSSSPTGSQSSVINEQENTQLLEKSNGSVSEEKSPRSEAVDVKKRVSEIMADANQGSRGDKSPKLQDFYTTTYDLVSPANSPELGSPTEEHKYMTAKSIFGTEAEELLRKQLAIEQEIKQITEQQQKEQLPYLFVREIPNKPPPPYTPPSSIPSTNVISIIPTSEEIENITKYSAKILHKAYLSNNLDNISISENTLSLISKDITKESYKFVFDLCKEISKEHYKQFEKEECLAWLQVKKNPRLTVIKPLDVTGLEKHMNKKLKELFGYEKPVRRENTIIKWSRKKRDHVDEILVMESQAEETQWTNYDKDELLVMNEVTNEIMNMLLKETGEVFSKILSQQTFQ